MRQVISNQLCRSAFNRLHPRLLNFRQFNSFLIHSSPFSLFLYRRWSALPLIQMGGLPWTVDRGRCNAYAMFRKCLACFRCASSLYQIYVRNFADNPRNLRTLQTSTLADYETALGISISYPTHINLAVKLKHTPPTCHVPI